MLIYLIAALFVLDTALTIYALRTFPRHFVEGNGILAKLMAAIGREQALIMVKAAALGAIYWTQPAQGYLLIITAGYAGVVAWNGWLIVKRLRA